jgi:hypothetical protein
VGYERALRLEQEREQASEWALEEAPERWGLQEVVTLEVVEQAEDSEVLAHRWVIRATYDDNSVRPIARV